MPIYQWKCEKCGAVVEELRKMDDTEPPESCGQCGDACECGKGPCEFKRMVTSANFRIDPAAGPSKNYKIPEVKDDE